MRVQAPDLNSKGNSEILKDIRAAVKGVNDKKFTGVIIMGDFNLPDIDWNGHCRMNRQSARFKELAVELGLTQLVESSTFDNADGHKSLIDLIFTNEPERVGEVRHSAPLGLAKQAHQVLEVEYQLRNPNKPSFTSKNFIWSKGQYEELSEAWRQVDWEKIFSDKCVDSCYEIWLKLYGDLSTRYIPRRSTLIKIHRSPWIGKEVNEPIKIKRQLYYAGRNTKWKDKSMKKKYRAAKIRASKLVKHSVAHYETSLATSKKNPKTLFAYINQKANVKTGLTSLMNENGQMTHDKHEIAELLNKQFQSVFTEEDGDAPLPHMDSRTEASLSTLNIEEQAVLTHLSALSEYKSVGPDGVSPLVLKKCATAMFFSIKLLFEKSLKEGAVPTKWKQANISAIFKKVDRGRPENYRPISLTSVLGKTMEKLVRQAVVEHLVEHRLIARQQHGFVNRKNCTTNLLETKPTNLVSIWYTSITRKRSTQFHTSD